MDPNSIDDNTILIGSGPHRVLSDIADDQKPPGIDLKLGRNGWLRRPNGYRKARKEGLFLTALPSYKPPTRKNNSKAPRGGQDTQQITEFSVTISGKPGDEQTARHLLDFHWSDS